MLSRPLVKDVVNLGIKMQFPDNTLVYQSFGSMLENSFKQNIDADFLVLTDKYCQLEQQQQQEQQTNSSPEPSPHPSIDIKMDPSFPMAAHEEVKTCSKKKQQQKKSSKPKSSLTKVKKPASKKKIEAKALKESNLRVNGALGVE